METKDLTSKIVAIGTAEYLVSGTLVGSGTVVTPFADSKEN